MRLTEIPFDDKVVSDMLPFTIRSFKAHWETSFSEIRKNSEKPLVTIENVAWAEIYNEDETTNAYDIRASSLFMASVNERINRYVAIVDSCEASVIKEILLMSDEEFEKHIKTKEASKKFGL